MARVLVAAQTLPGSYPTLPVTPGSDLSEQAADASLFQYTPLVAGKTVVIAHNTDSGAHTVTFTSVADAQNRTGDITAYSLAAGHVRAFGPFLSAGWVQDGTQLWFAANDATVKFIVLTLP